MSSSIAIPARKKKASDATAATPSSSRSSYGSFGSPSAASVASSPPPAFQHVRRPSLMSPAFAKTEHTVVNVGNSEVPRLITCVKASQGFDWNQEIFLPSHAHYAFDDLERRQDPVQDIFVSDEEVARMFPS